MREQFPITRKGDRLTHEHVNRLSTVARRLSGSNTGSYANGVVNSSFSGQAPLLPFTQEIVKVTELLAPDIYAVRVMYYDSDTFSWATSTEEYEMTSRAIGSTYVVDDVVIAFHHAQSGYFIPVGEAASTVLRIGKAKGVISAGAVNGIVTIWENGAATTTEQTDVRHDWMTNGTAIANNTEVVIGYFRAEGFWRVIGAACP